MAGRRVRHNADVTISEERRLVTIVFVDMVGFTSRAEASDPEIVRDVQRAYFAAVTSEVERYGGSVEKYIGDAVMATYGAPRAHDDDAERALHAALGIRSAVLALGHELEVRIGVNTGEVVGGAGAGPQAGEYTVTGDAVNIAARLQQAAEPDEIYVGPTTRRLAAEAFDFAPMPALELKGKTEPVEAWRLVRALPGRPRVRGGETPLIGRRREVALLEGALETAADGRGLLVGLSGEAGIGKSRMALELRARAEAQGFDTGWATALSFASAFPYHLVAQLVEHLLQQGPDASVGDALRSSITGAEREGLDRWAAALADVTGTAGPEERALLADVTPSARQRLLVQAMRAILAERAGRRPQLIVLDDLHWADASSLSVLDELLALVPEHAIVVLALYRPGWDNPWAGRSFYQQLNLGRLRTEEAEELVRALSPMVTLEPGHAEELLHRSGGNPFFLEELLRGSATGIGERNRRLPETVYELLLARIDALPHDARAVLQLAAVVGTEFSERVVAALEPIGDLPAALNALQRDDLIVARGGDLDDSTFAIRHPLVQEVAYRSLLVARRRVLHGRIAVWLEEHGGDEALSAIAAHYRDADDRERAREFLPRAAERAARLNAQREALRWYLEAADLFDDEPGRRAEMLERAATQSYLLGDLQPAIDLVSEAGTLYEVAGDRLHALDCRRWLGRYYWMDGRGRQAEAEIIAAIEGLEQLPPSPELALAISYRSQLRMLMPDFVTGERLARQAIAVGEQVDSIETLTHAYNNLGMCMLGQGDPSGIDQVRHGLALALEHNLVDDASRAYTNLSGQGSAVSLFTYEEAEALYEEMLAYDRRVMPGGAYEQWHLAGQAELWIAVGRWDDAEPRLEELARIPGANRYVQVDIAAFHALVAAYRGRYAEAAAEVRPHVERAVQIADLQAYAPVFLALAHAERGGGEDAAAADALERGIRIRGDMHENSISSWYLFEAVDIATWLALVRPLGDPLREHVVAVLTDFAHALEADIARGGTEPELLVRRALYGAAVAQLQSLSGKPDRDLLRGYAADLRRAHRIFDAARIELWVAESTGKLALADEARLVFEQLGANPYVARAAPNWSTQATNR